MIKSPTDRPFGNYPTLFRNKQTEEQMKFGSTMVPDEWLGHFDMLRDKKRNFFYAQTILSNKSLVSSNIDKYCIDIGCGSGLLCCLVAKLTHKKCIAFEVDFSIILYYIFRRVC